MIALLIIYIIGCLISFVLTKWMYDCVKATHVHFETDALIIGFTIVTITSWLLPVLLCMLTLIQIIKEKLERVLNNARSKSK